MTFAVCAEIASTSGNIIDTLLTACQSYWAWRCEHGCRGKMNFCANCDFEWPVYFYN